MLLDEVTQQLLVGTLPVRDLVRLEHATVRSRFSNPFPASVLRWPTYRGVPKGAAQVDGLLEDWLSLLQAEIGAHGGTEPHGAKSGDWNLGAAEWK